MNYGKFYAWICSENCYFTKFHCWLFSDVFFSNFTLVYSRIFLSFLLHCITICMYIWNLIFSKYFSLSCSSKPWNCQQCIWRIIWQLTRFVWLYIVEWDLTQMKGTAFIYSRYFYRQTMTMQIDQISKKGFKITKMKSGKTIYTFILLVGDILLGNGYRQFIAKNRF